MKILITGSAGFIGYHLSYSLLKDGHDIIGVDNINDYYDTILKKDRLSILLDFENYTFIKTDICDKESMERVFTKNNPEMVINLAAQAGVRYSLLNPDAYTQSNLVGYVNLVELCRQNEVKGLIYASSSSVYGANNQKPFAEKDRINKPMSLYGASKRANELIAHSYSHLYSLNTTGLRFFTVYGPWYRPDMAMYIFIDKIMKSQPIQVFNNGKMKRDFTYIDDIIDGIKSAILNNYECEIFNLGNNKSERLMDVISIIEKFLGKKADIEFRSLQKGDMIETFADIEHSNNKLNYTPKISIDEGIKELVKWYKKYYEA
tara:strand:- start:5352 stop:6305 length:954 start_codon:yes stop_codon:yes gene_type:complete